MGLKPGYLLKKFLLYTYFLQQLLFPQQFLKIELELATMASDGEGDGGIEEARADGSGGP